MESEDTEALDGICGVIVEKPYLLHFVSFYYAPQLVPAGTAEARISYGDSVCPSVRPSQAGAEPSAGEIETPGLHHMVAWGI